MPDLRRNLISATQTADYYDRLWASFGTDLDYTDRNRAEFIVNNIREFVSGSSLKILDFGCGRGWMAPFLSPFGSVTGIDFSEVGIEFARKNYGNHAHFMLANPQVENLGLPSDSRFNVVVCSEVIEHVPDPADLLSQIAEILEPGGWCMLTTPNGNVWQKFQSQPVFKAQLQPIENWLSPNQLATILGNAGFRILRHEGRPVFGFRVGLAGCLQRSRIERTFKKIGHHHLYGRLILPTAVYQLVVAQKR